MVHYVFIPRLTIPIFRTEAERKRMNEERKELEDYQIQQEHLREQQLQVH